MTKLTGEEIEKREALKRLMQDDMFALAIEDIKKQIGADILKENDPGNRERLYFEASLLNRLQSTLESYVTDLLFLKQKKTEEVD